MPTVGSLTNLSLVSVNDGVIHPICMKRKQETIWSHLAGDCNSESRSLVNVVAFFHNSRIFPSPLENKKDRSVSTDCNLHPKKGRELMQFLSLVQFKVRTFVGFVTLKFVFDDKCFFIGLTIFRSFFLAALNKIYMHKLCLL